MKWSIGGKYGEENGSSLSSSQRVGYSSGHWEGKPDIYAPQYDAMWSSHQPWSIPTHNVKPESNKTFIQKSSLQEIWEMEEYVK